MVLADFRVERTDPRLRQDQAVAAVLADGEAFVHQPDGRLAVIREVNPEHVGSLEAGQ
ncbi:hypothetical protein D3C77_802410 [compost metagenome]